LRERSSGTKIAWLKKRLRPGCPGTMILNLKYCQKLRLQKEKGRESRRGSLYSGSGVKSGKKGRRKKHASGLGWSKPRWLIEKKTQANSGKGGGQTMEKETDRR